MTDAADDDIALGRPTDDHPELPARHAHACRGFNHSHCRDCITASHERLSPGRQNATWDAQFPSPFPCSPMRSGSVANENFPVSSVSVLETRPACRVCGSPGGSDTHIYYQTSHQVTKSPLLISQTKMRWQQRRRRQPLLLA